MMYFYQITTEKLINEAIGDYISFGITVKDESNRTLNSIQDVSVDYEAVASIVKLCNDNCLEPIHLLDVVEDMICNDV